MWPPDPLEESSVRAALAGRGARPWQLDLVVPVLLQAMSSATAQDLDAAGPAGA